MSMGPSIVSLLKHISHCLDVVYGYIIHVFRTSSQNLGLLRL